MNDDEMDIETQQPEPPLSPREGLYALLSVAEQHQDAVQSVLKGVAIERGKLAHERALLAGAVADAVDSVARAAAKAVADVSGLSQTLDNAVAEAARTISKAAALAAVKTVDQALAEAGQTVADAAAEATKPVVGKLSDTVKAADEAGQKLQSASQWFGMKAFALAGFAMLIAAITAWAAVGWQLHQVEQLSAQRQALVDDIAQMQAGAAALAKKGARIKMSECGGRLCIEANPNQSASFPNWRSPWRSEQDVPLVIPQGY